MPVYQKQQFPLFPTHRNYNGQLWCYVHQGRYSTCYDKVASRRFTNEYYSSRACYTPSPYSHECRGGSFQSLGGNSDYYGLDNEIYDEPYRYRGRYGFRRRYGRR